ncbi:MAG TPA: hypothetical protein VG816_08285 [Solirubrobacterales bacterium]|nr:hypothetical protein [Solirubrobacterales bacterium]
MTRISKVLTFSNVVAFIALFVALGGSVYAASKISGTQIEPGSLPGNRIKAKSVAGNRIRPRSLTGRQVKANSLGAGQIKESTLTGITSSAIGAVHYSTITVLISNTPAGGNQGTAVCPAGTYVIGGGASVNDENFAYVNDSGPSATHAGWTATAYGEPGATMTVTAICTAVHSIGTSMATSGNPPSEGPHYWVR